MELSAIKRARALGLDFVQSCSQNNIHIATAEGKAACSSNIKVFRNDTPDWMGCSRCLKKLEKLEKE
jgi:hypothetical protein